VKRYELTFRSVAGVDAAKPICMLVIEPDEVGPRTGCMLFTHGWGGNRYQYEEMMAYAVDAFDLVAVSVEYRQSGYDFDPVRGEGADLPYDASFYQVFDVLNGLRRILSLRPGIDRSRIFHYGGSQGGHIALLGSIFAPNTFAFVYAACPITHMDLDGPLDPGRDFSEREKAIRDVVALSDRIGCKVYLEHGTADEVVPHDRHTVPLEEKLRRTGKLAGVRYHQGARHSLEPITTRLESFKRNAPAFLKALTNDRVDDFAAGRTIKIPCEGWTLVIDWSKGPDEPGLFSWESSS